VAPGLEKKNEINQTHSREEKCKSQIVFCSNFVGGAVLWRDGIGADE
jgi:hypothetical protein